ncbi:MAG: argininosuccinate lyase [candidate division WS6 bacterium OLB20]|uniref:Argininosuccinate lyase n=1 Tax=candidate division WS6 bacterium OLB20 TaxID=1617426 RepID=A0A136LYF0_9BACT|nr:MAG: argininosuccinate lyase [candidate division WS6 bacterium OLB20]
MSSHVLILGIPTADLVEDLNRAGYRVSLIEDTRKLQEHESVSGFSQVIKADFDRFDSVRDAVGQLNTPVDAVISRYENYTVAKQQVCELLGLPTASADSILASTDKLLQRKRFAEYAPEITPAFTKITSVEEALSFAGIHGYPLISKPTNLVKSLLVKRSDTPEQLEQNISDTLREISGLYNKYRVTGREKNIILEQYLEGSFHSVECFMDSDRHVHFAPSAVDLVMGPQIGFNDNFNYSRKLPSALSAEETSLLFEAAGKAMKALDLVYFAGHVEAVMTENGPRIIEVNSRVGGYRSRMFNWTNGINLNLAEATVAMGQKPQLDPVKSGFCAVYEVFPKTPGTVTEITGIKDLRGTSAVRYISVKAEPGEYAGLSRDGYKAACVIIILTEDSGEFDTFCARVEDTVHVLTS